MNTLLLPKRPCPGIEIFTHLQDTTPRSSPFATILCAHTSHKYDPELWTVRVKPTKELEFGHLNNKTVILQKDYINKDALKDLCVAANIVCTHLGLHCPTALVVPYFTPNGIVSTWNTLKTKRIEVDSMIIDYITKDELENTTIEGEKIIT